LPFPFLALALDVDRTRCCGGGGLFDLTENIEVVFPRFALSIKALAAFSFLPNAGGDDSFSFAFVLDFFGDLGMIAGGRGISSLELEWIARTVREGVGYSSAQLP
jgi:hypothetical protein